MQSVNDLCCTGEYTFGNLDAKRDGGRFRVDHEFKLIGLLDRNLAGLSALQDARADISRPPRDLSRLGAVNSRARQPGRSRRTPPPQVDRTSWLQGGELARVRREYR